MRLVAAMAAIALLLLAGPLTGAARAATPALGAPAEAPVSGSPLTLVLEQVTPRLVTADGPETITVAGTLVNNGPVAVDEIEIRLQRGDELRTEGEIRTAIEGSAAADAVTPQFTDLPGVLVPGEHIPVRFTMPLRGDPGTGLALSQPGVYELLVNVNGMPAGGARARLAAVRMLLPVLSLPPDPAAGASLGSASTRTPTTPFTLLYPIADAPRRLPGVPGEITTLTDDDLADSFAPGGRLNGLVAALAQRAPVGSRVREATCLAVDPDLVQTAAAMRDGYQVRAPDGTRTPGRGAAAAGSWLDALAATARGSCVLALPMADADLVALTRGGLTERAAQAVTDGRELLTEALGTPVLDGTLWPVDGLLDEPTLAAVGTTSAASTSTFVLSAEGIERSRTTTTTGVVRIAAAQPGETAVLIDPLLNRAAVEHAGPGSARDSDSETGAVPTTSTAAGTSTPLSTQDIIGALLFRAQQGPRADASGPLVLAPPHQWAADGTGADALLSAVSRMLDETLLQPRALATGVATGPAAASGSRRLFYPVRAGAREIPPAVIDRVRTVGDEVERLRGAAEIEPGVGVSPAEVFDPVMRATLRATSAAWRGYPDLAERSMTLISDRIGELRSSVRVLEPPGPYSLGTNEAPLLLTVANGLPVAMKVRVELRSTAGLKVAPIPQQRVPPLGRIQVRVNAEVTRSGQFAVDATVRTPDGGALGPPTRLQVRSTAYGTITVWLTGVAGVLLVVLVVRRMLRRDHRKGGAPAPSRLRPVEPDPGGGAPRPAASDPSRPTRPGPGPAAPPRVPTQRP
ncbi:DUF6049 family protein [Pseudonocardia asaccharolytica]|uniref:Glycoprotein n=1 Tax=Pseudonocardia asaccharolytica DSM 44247 = NBRC 16224 TaxID=1123024 RepID=A0A511D409_9PSEU|nr:DUF6049 family protein [Pseudonocardia asaccharolytica]GEL19397.1 hypothetical protein PA7_32340 [Pseudonocardia asaccharolytica DSM 44247 = NBRC 16224]